MGHINHHESIWGVEIFYTINKQGECGGGMGRGDAAAVCRAELQRASTAPAVRRAVDLYWNMQGITVICQKSLRV